MCGSQSHPDHVPSSQGQGPVSPLSTQAPQPRGHSSSKLKVFVHAALSTVAEGCSALAARQGLSWRLQDQGKFYVMGQVQVLS